MVPKPKSITGVSRRSVDKVQHPQPRKTKLLTKKHQILNLIFREKQCSRFALARRLNINASMVGNYIDEFLREGLLLEDQRGASRRGRSAVMVRLNPDAGCFLGLDFEAMRARAVLTDFAGESISQKEAPFRASITRQRVLDSIVALARQTAECARGRRLLAVGLAAPGQVDGPRGRILNYELLSDFAEVPLKEQFEPHFDVPIFVEDNIRALTFAEMLRGAGRGHENFLCLTVRSGLGLGIVIDGRIYAGAGAMAGEVGYTVFPHEGRARTLTDLVSATGILRRAQRVLRSARGSSRQALLEKGDDLSLADVVDAAEGGDALLTGVLDEAGHNLGLLTANLANLFAPEKIILAGEVPHCCAAVRRKLEQVFRQHTLAQVLRHTYLENGALTGFAAAMGAAYLGFARTFPNDGSSN